MHALLTYPYLTVSLHEGPVPVLELQWLSYVGSADFRTAVGQLLQLSRVHQVKGWVVDDRQQGAIRPRDLEWAEHEILPSLSDLGLLRYAHLPVQDLLSRLNVDQLYTRVMPQMQFELRHFTDIALARAWASGADLASPIS